MLESKVKQSIYFVLGNHDYYLSLLNEVRSKIRKLCNASDISTNHDLRNALICPNFAETPQVSK